MEKLAKREEQIMKAFWKLDKALIKEIIELIPEPKPHYNSVATMVRILEKKGFLKHVVHGRNFFYSPLISEESYKTFLMNSVVDKYFNNSYPNMVSYFAQKQKLSESDLQRILNLIKNEGS